jgi:hypothetical protein
MNLFAIALAQRKWKIMTDEINPDIAESEKNPVDNISPI